MEDDERNGSMRACKQHSVVAKHGSTTVPTGGDRVKEHPTHHLRNQRQPPEDRLGQLRLQQYATDDRHMPADSATFDLLEKEQLTMVLWVFGYQLFYLYTYSLQIPVHQCTLLQHEFIQYFEWRVRGCQFTNAAWTLQMRNVHGYNLFKQVNLERLRSSSPLTDNERLDRTNIQKVILCVLITPGYYGCVVRQKRITITLNMALEHWPTEGSQQINVIQIDVCRQLAALDVPVDLVDNVFLFAYNFIFYCQHGANLSACRTWTVPPISVPGQDSPFMPWKSEVDNILLSARHNPFTQPPKQAMMSNTPMVPLWSNSSRAPRGMAHGVTHSSGGVPLAVQLSRPPAVFTITNTSIDTSIHAPNIGPPSSSTHGNVVVSSRPFTNVAQNSESMGRQHDYYSNNAVAGPSTNTSVAILLVELLMPPEPLDLSPYTAHQMMVFGAITGPHKVMHPLISWMSSSAAVHSDIVGFSGDHRETIQADYPSATDAP
ncbi:hypothetical protein B0H16DRAFT_1463476 [Mycena metata]|uniref:Uncharacterized protein n=1 Tax=Mycena metata TaxID=1033252 RepID=A0AAD7IIC4_9AGAR|nr:hypothetical protein B0H16DRAFT_1463476 [Mycena metata]